MKKETLVKIILIIFFLVFFSFLFWYFYKPTKPGTFIDKISNSENIFPFSDIFTSNEGKIITPEKTTSEKKEIEKEEKIPRLRQISKVPTAGVYFELLNEEELIKYNRNRGRKNQVSLEDNISEIRYIVSKNGHIFNTYTNTLQENRISNVTIPKIYEVLFFNKNNFIIRYLNKSNTIKTYSVVLADKTEEELQIEREQNKDGLVDKNLKSFDGVFFPNNILKITKSPTGNNVFYLKKQDDNSIVGITSKFLAGDKKEIFKFDFKEWNIFWVDKNKILFVSEPSKNTYSISMVLNLVNKTFRRISKPLLAGNVLANPDFSKILYSGIYNGKYILLIYDKKTNKRTSLKISTLVDKCVWSKNNVDVFCAVPKSSMGVDQPDAWYRGYNYFADTIYKINTESGNFSVIYYNNKNQEFDMTELRLDESENYIYWIDKKTGTAWSYLIYEPAETNLEEESTEQKTE